MKQIRSSSLARLRRHGPPPRAERGVVVIIALIVLVAMMLAGIATMRSSGSAILTAGNLALRQAATVSGDIGGEVALAWLRAQGPVTLETRNPAQGYYVTYTDQEPPTGLPFNPVTWGDTNWRNAARAVQVNGGAADSAGNVVSYVIHRMCMNPIAITPPTGTAQECVTVADPGKGGSKDEEKAFTGSSQAYYRITARIEGPKNTVSYIQVMVY
jgi:type IV pilus assembly protein PilX